MLLLYMLFIIKLKVHEDVQVSADCVLPNTC